MRELIFRLSEEAKEEDPPIVLTFSLVRLEHIIVLQASDGKRKWHIASINSGDGKLHLSMGIGQESGLCLDATGRIVVNEPC